MAGGARFNFIHFMHYVHLPENHKEFHSLWVDFPEQIFRSRKGHALYQRYLSEFVLADKLGFDAIVVNEHHNTAYSMMPAPNLIAATLIPQIKNAKICVWGTPPNLEYPNRLAEEYAMLDVLSQGRLEVAFPLGTGMEYWANPINPATARERYRESIDIILQAWTQDGPTNYYGDFYTYRYLNPWPRPVQKPHPPCYIVGTGSPETIELAAKLGFGYASVFVTKQRARELNEKLRRSAAEHGHHIRPEQLPLQVITYVAETEEKAREEGDRAHPLFLRGCAAHHADLPCAARLPLGRSAEEARGAWPTSCTASSTSRRRRIVLRRRRHRRPGRGKARTMGRADGDQPFRHARRDRQHAELEGREKPQPDRAGRDPARARAGAAYERRVAAE